MVNSVEQTVSDCSINVEIDNALPIFMQSDWFLSFENYLIDDKDSPQFLRYIPDNETNAFIPFYAQLLIKKFHTKQLFSMTNYYSPFFSMVNYGRDKASISELILTHKSIFLEYDEIYIQPLYENDAVEYIEVLASIGLKCFPHIQTVNWFHDDIDCFDTFHKRISKNMRNNTRRAKKHIDEEGGFKIEISCLDALEQKLLDYHAVYSDSWKQEEPYPEFINQIARTAASKNQLRLGIIYHNDIAVAAQMWFIDATTAYIFKLSYKEAYAERSIGNILTMALCRHTIEIDKVSTIDFLTGNDSYKKRWMTKNRNLIALKVTNPKRILGLMGTYKENLSLLKSKLKNRTKNQI